MSDTETKVQPALAPAEWNIGQRVTLEQKVRVEHDGNGSEFLTIQDKPHHASYAFSGNDRHALAALALHGQPFGFTWADVDTLAKEVGYMEAATEYQVDPEITDRLRSLIDRIAALLPPR